MTEYQIVEQTDDEARHRLLTIIGEALSYCCQPDPEYGFVFGTAGAAVGYARERHDGPD